MNLSRWVGIVLLLLLGVLMGFSAYGAGASPSDPLVNSPLGGASPTASSTSLPSTPTVTGTPFGVRVSSEFVSYFTLENAPNITRFVGEVINYGPERARHLMYRLTLYQDSEVVYEETFEMEADRHLPNHEIECFALDAGASGTPVPTWDSYEISDPTYTLVFEEIASLPMRDLESGTNGDGFFITGRTQNINDLYVRDIYAHATLFSADNSVVDCLRLPTDPNEPFDLYPGQFKNFEFQFTDRSNYGNVNRSEVRAVGVPVTYTLTPQPTETATPTATATFTASPTRSIINLYLPLVKRDQ